MSDLISRSALINKIVNTPTEESGYNHVYLNGCATRQFEILDMIDELPTAYDVDKVERMIKGRFTAEFNTMKFDAFSIVDLCADVCRIVRAGGKE